MRNKTRFAWRFVAPAAAGRATFATLWGIEKTRLAADELTREAKKSLDIFDEDKSFLSALADWLLRREY